MARRRRKSKKRSSSAVSKVFSFAKKIPDFIPVFLALVPLRHLTANASMNEKILRMRADWSGLTPDGKFDWQKLVATYAPVVLSKLAVSAAKKRWI